jgi:hypothetical protein
MITVNNFRELIEQDQTIQNLSHPEFKFYLGAQILERFLLWKHFLTIDDPQLQLHVTSISGASCIDGFISKNDQVIGVIECKVRYIDSTMYSNPIIEIKRYQSLMELSKTYDVVPYYVNFYLDGPAIWNNLNDCITNTKMFKRMGSDTYNTSNVKDYPCYTLNEHDPDRTFLDPVFFQTSDVFIREEMNKRGYPVDDSFTLRKK